MKQLHQKIEARKRAINEKKEQFATHLTNTRHKLGFPATLSLPTISALLIGFLLLPKKYRLLKFTLKALTMATTAKQILDTLSHQPTSRRRNNVHELHG